jgi:hypothetical protein
MLNLFCFFIWVGLVTKCTVSVLGMRVITSAAEW